MPISQVVDILTNGVKGWPVPLKNFPPTEKASEENPTEDDKPNVSFCISCAYLKPFNTA